MQATTGHWASPLGFDIFHRCWDPGSPARGQVLLVHGLSEHSGRYGHVAQALVDRGWRVHAFDHLGHGQSSGARQRIQRFEDLSDTLAAFRQHVHAQAPQLPLVMIGHSMGGLLAANDAADHPDACAAVVLSAPAVQVSPHISAWTVRIGRLLSVLAPDVGVLGLDPVWISRDPAVVSAYQADPLVNHNKTPARLAAELLRAMQNLAPKLHRISAPLWVIQGTQDRLVDPDGARFLMSKVSSPERHLQLYDGLYHECFNEPERAQVLVEMCDWLDGVLPASTDTAAPSASIA